MPTKPRTQRKALYALELHRKHALVSVHIGKELKAKLKTGARSLPLRKGDRVKIMRGSHRGKSGKVLEVDLKKSIAFIEGIVVRKAKGGEVQVPLQPSNLLMVDGDFGDEGRKKLLARKNRG